MAYVGGATVNGPGGTGAFSLSITYSPIAGNTLVFLANLQGYAAGATDLQPMTDNASGGSSTYVQPTGNFVAPSGNTGDWMAYCQAVKAGVTTITASWSIAGNNASFSSLVVAEFSGLGLLDVAGAMRGQNPAPSTTDGVTSTGATTTVNGDTIIGLTIDWTGGGTIAAGTGFTVGLNVASAYLIEYRTQATAGAGTLATYTASSTTDIFATGMLAFLPLPVTVPSSFGQSLFRVRGAQWR